jgi:hypothetical protein
VFLIQGLITAHPVHEHVLVLVQTFAVYIAQAEYHQGICKQRIAGVATCCSVANVLMLRKQHLHVHGDATNTSLPVSHV